MRQLIYILIFVPISLVAKSRGPDLVKEFPLDERSVYSIGVGQEVPTTVMFPGKIAAISGANIAVAENADADLSMSHTENAYFFHVRAIKDNSNAAANVIYKGKTYVLSFYADENPMRSVTFYEPQAASGRVQRRNVTPEVLLGLLDRAKNYKFFEYQYPEIVQQIDVDYPKSLTLYKEYDVELDEVLRFDQEDTLVFRVKFTNKTDCDIYYQPQRLGVRVGENVYYASITDASGIMPAYSDTYGYFAITGKPNGGRANLSVRNDFNVIVTQVEDVSLIIPEKC